MSTRSLLLLAALAILSSSATAQTADEIVARNIAARGGLEKFHSIRTMTALGRLSGPGMDAPIRVQLKRPNKYRMDLTLRDQILTRVYDDGSAWQVMPSANPEAQPLSGGELLNIQDEADLDGPLVDYQAKGHKVELVGKEDVNGTSCYKLKITLKTGHLMYQYLDAKSFLEIREEIVRTNDGNDSVIEETVGDYKEVGGILFPHSFDSNSKGSADHFKLHLDKIEVNVNLDDLRFKMPSYRRSGSR